MGERDDNQPDRPFVPFSDLMSKVGYFLLCWSKLELALTDAIRERHSDAMQAPGRVCGTFGERLEQWCELAAKLPENKSRAELVAQIAHQARSIRRIRNLIVHGLMGGHSMPDTAPGYIECAVGGYDKPTGEKVRYSIEDLEHLTQAADACRRGFRDVESFNYYLEPASKAV